MLALYLVSSPHANMIGLYYLPLVTLCHETGLDEEGARKALRRTSEADFAHYDEEAELVWVPNAAAYQIGETLKPGDKQRIGVLNELRKFREASGNHRFADDFAARYTDPYSLDVKDEARPEGKGHRRPSKAPSKAPRSQDQDQDQEQDQDQDPPKAPQGGEGGGEGNDPKPEEPRSYTPGLWLDSVAEFQAGYHEVTGNTLHLQGRENSKVADIMAKDCPCPSDPPKRMVWSREEGRRFGRACKGRTTVNAFAYRDWASAGRQESLVPEKGHAHAEAAPQRPEHRLLDLGPPPKKQNASRAPPGPSNEGPASGVNVTGLKGAANG